MVGGRTQPLDLSRCLRHDSRALLEKAVLLGTRDRVAARLIAVRMPEAIVNVNERRRQAHAVAKKRGYTPSQAHLTLLAWNLFVTNVPAPVWPPKTVGVVYSFRWQVELVFKAWKSGLHLATLTSTTKHSTLCYLYGRLLLIVLTFALCPSLRAVVWQQQQREVSLLKLVRHFQASADQWLQVLFQSVAQLARFLVRACAAATLLVTKEVRKRPTSAQSLRKSFGGARRFFRAHTCSTCCITMNVYADRGDDKIMHTSLRIGETTLMASDGSAQGSSKFHGFSLSLSMSNEAEADRCFNVLADGGHIQMPLDKTFWSRRFGRVTDRFGLGWMIIVSDDQAEAL